MLFLISSYLATWTSPYGHPLAGLTLDELIAPYWESTYEDFFPHLWDSVTYMASLELPQDIEVRMVFYRKDHLQALGWTEEEIADLVEG